MRKSGNSINFIDKAIVFDFDGVILDTDEHLYKVFSNARNYFNLKKITKSQFKREFEKNPKYILQCEKFLLKIPFLIRVTKEIRRNARSIELTPGFEELIKDCFSDFVLFVCSHNLSFIINRTLRSHGLETYFKTIFSTGFLYKKREILKNISKHYSRLDVLFITDTPSDVKEAKIIGIKTVAVSFGIALAKDLKEAKPDKIVKNITELKKYISEFKSA